MAWPLLLIGLFAGAFAVFSWLDGAIDEAIAYTLGSALNIIAFFYT
jgi:hypothetical protein